jgi:beta-barrel assembly-enhancing protease
MSRPCTRFSQWHRACAWILLVAFFLAGCGGTRIPSVLPSIAPPSEDEETRISREFRREAKKQLKFVSDPEVERYVDRIGQRILAAMGPQPFDYRFFVVEDTQLNAFAVPGGSIYFYTGLIGKAKSSSEIAGVLGHEIVHIKGHHMARSSGPDAISLLSLASLLLLTRSSAGAQAASTVGQAVAATRQIAYSRQLEMEADTLGVRYMTAAGYDPKGSLGFLKILDQERTLNPIDLPAYMLTHPVTQERVANVELVIRSLGKTVQNAEEFDPLKKVQLIIRTERRERDAVIAEYQNSLRQNPQNAEALHLLGFAQFLTGDFMQAQQNYERALRLKPHDPMLHRDLARLLTQTGDYASARSAYERAIVLEPKEPLTYLYFGEMYEKQADFRSAAGAYLNAASLSPLWDKPAFKLGQAYSKLDRLGDAYYYLGRSFLLQDEDDKAMPNYEKAIKILGAKSPRGQLIQEELNTLRARRR